MLLSQYAVKVLIVQNGDFNNDPLIYRDGNRTF